MSEPKYVAQTLAWCNARRKERGKEPLEKLPKGKVRSPKSCPCGAATGLNVGWAIAVPLTPSGQPSRSKKLEIKLPYSVRSFIRAFDAGRLPQYEAKLQAAERSRETA